MHVKMKRKRELRKRNKIHRKRKRERYLRRGGTGGREGAKEEE